MVKQSYNVKYVKNEQQLAADAASSLKDRLEQLPNVTISITKEPTLAHGRPDLLVEVVYGDNQKTLVCEVERNAEPLQARNAIYQLKQYISALPDAIPVFIAPYISPRTAQLCRDEQVCYLDLAGNCHLTFDYFYIHVEGKPNPLANSRTLRSLYQPKAESVLRVLLTPPLRPWRVQSLAKEANVSIGQAHKVKELLLDREWLTDTREGVLLTRPTELLADWVQHYRFQKHQATQFYTLTGLDEFERILSVGCRQRDIPCAFTAFAAAARYAPYAVTQRTMAYVDQTLEAVQQLLLHPILQLAPVTTGANVVLLTPYDEGVFYGAQDRGDVQIASPVQIYLDLQHTGGRGQEAAEVLLEKVLLPQW